jgi:hypothetical protein
MSLLFCYAAVMFGLLMIALASYSNTKQREQEKIHTYLTEQGNEVIDIALKSAANMYGRPNEFEITYMTPENERYKVRCICWTRSDLFWTTPEPLREITLGAQERQIHRGNGPALISAENYFLDKETIIDKLTSGIMQERIQMVEQLAKIEQVDELIHYILMDMSFDDPEPEVREAARKTLHYLETSAA